MDDSIHRAVNDYEDQQGDVVSSDAESGDEVVATPFLVRCQFCYMIGIILRAPPTCRFCCPCGEGLAAFENGFFRSGSYRAGGRDDGWEPDWSFDLLVYDTG